MFFASPAKSLFGTITIPGDKSISHRSVILGAIATGVTEVTGFLEGHDCIATINAFKAMGVPIEGPDQGRLIIHGVGMHKLRAPAKALDVGNSGTSMRLLAGLLCAQPFNSTLTGDASLIRRPMQRVILPLAKMGAWIDSDKGYPPLNIRGGQSLKAIQYEMPLASAQVKSCLLLAGLYAHGTTTIIEPEVTRDHTERMLTAFGCKIKRQGNLIHLPGQQIVKANNIQIPADISSAAFFIVAACIAKRADLILQNIGINPTRIGILNILKMMGANISLQNQREIGGEPIADLHIKNSHLKGITIPQDQISLAIDEFPAIFIAAACAQGETVLTGAKELRVKESDRIHAMAVGLTNLGIEVVQLKEGIKIQGGQIQGGSVDSFSDHRIAMAFAIASAASAAKIRIKDCENVATSFPNFLDLAAKIGLVIKSRMGGCT